MIALSCAACQESLSVDNELAGAEVMCPRCGKSLAVPQPVTVAPQTLGQAMKDSVSGADVETGLGATPGEVTGTWMGAAPKQEAWDFLAPPQQPDEIGRLGPFRVLKVLGAGGMGVVFKADDPELNRPVALKAMLPSLAASESARKRFVREAQAAAAVVHDHIVRILQVGEDRGVPYLAMQFLEGESLADRLQREPRLTTAEILRIGRETALGLAAAHQRGLIHRDIKAANLWIEMRGRIKILDFGLARAAADDAHLTQTGAIVGTPAYMAPEQAAGENVGPRCDLFSLGCVLYRLLTGTMPFKGKDAISTLVAVATEDPAPPFEICPDAPAELSDLVMQLLAKKPEDRPESAEAVAEALHAIEERATNPAALRRAPRLRRRRKQRRSIPWRLGVNILGVALVGLLLAFLIWRDGRLVAWWQKKPEIPDDKKGGEIIPGIDKSKPLNLPFIDKSKPLNLPFIDKSKRPTPLVNKVDTKNVNKPKPPVQPIHDVGKNGLTLHGTIAADDPKLLTVTGNSTQHHLAAKQFLVKLSAGKRYRISMVSNEFDSYLYVTDTDKQQGAWDDDGGGDFNALLNYDAAKSGIYRVFAGAFKGTGKFTLEIREIGPAGINDVGKKGLILRGMIAADDPRVVPLEKGTDIRQLPAKKYQVRLLAGKKYRISMESDAIDPYLSVVGASGHQVAWDDDSGSNEGALVVLDVFTGGVFTVNAASFKGNGKFILKINEAGAARAYDVGVKLNFTGSLKDVESVAYNVRLAAGKAYVIDMLNADPKRLDPVLHLLAEDGKRLAKARKSGKDASAHIEFKASESGIYRIVATDFDRGDGAFTLTVRPDKSATGKSSAK